jgi:hypothetical protein
MVTALVALGILGYGSLDTPAQLMVRAAFVALMFLYSISALHVLAIARQHREKLHWYIAYGFILLRFLVVIAYACWLYANEVFSLYAI